MKMGSFVGWGLAALVAGGIFLSFYKGATNENVWPDKDELELSEEVIAEQEQILDSFSDEYTIGDENAPITLYNISSYSCPHCGDFYRDTYPALKEKYIDKGKLKIIVKEFATDRYGLAALMLINCIPETQYQNLTRTLYDNQYEWLTSHEPLKKLASYVRLLGMDQESFDGCLANEKLQKQVTETSYDTLRNYNIKYTPTFVVKDSDERIEGAKPFSEFEELLDRLLKERR